MREVTVRTQGLRRVGFLTQTRCGGVGSVEQLPRNPASPTEDHVAASIETHVVHEPQGLRVNLTSYPTPTVPVGARDHIGNEVR